MIDPLYISNTEWKIFEFLVIVVLALLSTGFALLKKKIKRLKENDWKHVPLPKWRGEMVEVRSYLEEGGLQNIGYSPDEGISGYAVSAVKSLDSFDEGDHSHSGYISGIYKDYLVQLSSVRLELVDDEEATRGAVLGGLSGSAGRYRYARSGFYTYFSGTWCIFRVKRKLRGDLYLIDRRLGDKDDRHGPGKHTSLPRLSLGWRLTPAFDGYTSEAEEGAADLLLSDEVQTLLLKLHEKHRVMICMSGSKIHIGISGRRHNFRHKEEETVEEWRAQQTLFETLNELVELVSHWGTPPSEDEYFF